MSKVEELRAELEKDIAVDAIGHHVYGDVADDIDSLIAAAREEGVEQERERIVRGSQQFSQGDDVADSDYISAVWATERDFGAVADCELFIISASVLSPAPKESK